MVKEIDFKHSVFFFFSKDLVKFILFFSELIQKSDDEKDM